ncbi:hypothetical protein [Paenibacillus sp. 1P07SE]|uniref:hypothetical protein n=1 Tax=Paenibacillus sp. 1P07SE TaxID=3132209 RepID=UPI0039A5A44B
MYIKIKVGTLVFWLAVVLLTVGIASAIRDDPKPDRLVSLIIDSNPMHDDRIDIRPSGHGYSQANDRKVSYAQALAYAQEMVQEYPEHPWSQEHSAYTLGHLYLKNGNRTEALKWFTEALSSFRAQEAHRWIDLLRPQVGESSSPALSGRVLIGGEPQSGAIVYLQPADASNWNSPGYLYNQATMTDDNGEYWFYNIEPGRYEVGVGLTPEQVDGWVRAEAPQEVLALESGTTHTFDVQFVPKLQTIAPGNGEEIGEEELHFQWEPYPGAVSYKLHIQSIELSSDGSLLSSSSGSLQEDWPGTEAVYTIAELRGYARGIHWNEDGPLPATILGVVYPGGHFSWSVDAYDEQGLRISSSTSYYGTNGGQMPLFSMSDEGQLAGDRHVLARDWEEAIAAYKQEEHHQEAIRALGLIYAFGEDLRGEGKNNELALSYLNRLTNPTAFDLQALDSLDWDAQRE